MRPSKLSFLLILIASVFVLSGASKSGDANPPQPLNQVRSDEHKTPTEHIETNADNQPNNPTPFQAQLLETLRAVAKQHKSAYEQTRPDQKSWNSPSVFINIGLLFIAAVYTFFAWRQWQAIRRQADITSDQIIEARKATEAAQRSADAAKLQIDLVISHERPWLIVNPDKEPDWLISNKDPFGGPVEWSVKNVGRTPAFLTELAVKVDIMPLPIPEQRPDYPQSKPFAKFIIPPNGTHSSRTGSGMDASELQLLFNGTHCLIFYGRITYRDNLDGVHLTRFCCYWHLQENQWIYEPVGPPDWVEHA